MKQLLILFISLLNLSIYSDDYQIIKTNKEITLEIVSPVQDIFKSNIYIIRIIDWLDEFKEYKAYRIINGSSNETYICICRNPFFLFVNPDDSIVIRNDIEVEIIKKKDYNIIMYEENGMRAIIYVYD